MDAALFVLLPKFFAPPRVEVPIDGTWSCTVADLRVRRCEVSEWAWQMLPVDRRAKEYDSYIIDDKTLTNLEAVVNDCLREEDAVLAEWLYETLVLADFWIVAFLWQWEDISAVRRTTPKEAIAHLREVLRWEAAKKGFLLYGP